MYTFLLLVVLESADAMDTDSDWLGWEGSLYWYTLAAASMVPVSNKNKFFLKKFMYFVSICCFNNL